MQHQNVPNRKRSIDVIEFRERTSSTEDVEEAFYEMLEALDDDAEELQEFVGGPSLSGGPRDQGNG